MPTAGRIGVFTLGAEAVLFHDFTVQAQMKFSEDFDPIYDGLYQAFVKWSPAEAFSVSAGPAGFSVRRPRTDGFFHEDRDV